MMRERSFVIVQSSAAMISRHLTKLKHFKNNNLKPKGYIHIINSRAKESGGIKMGEKIKKVFKAAVKLVGIICTAIVGAIVVCGLPFDEIKEKLERKFMN